MLSCVFNLAVFVFQHIYPYPESAVTLEQQNNSSDYPTVLYVIFSNFVLSFSPLVLSF